MQVIRPMFSNPPRHGAAIVVEVLSDPRLYAEWRVSTMAHFNDLCQWFIP